MISDNFQRLGLGTAFLERLIQIGRDEGVARIFGTILPENVGMRRICEKLGFRVSHVADDAVLKAEREL